MTPSCGLLLQIPLPVLLAHSEPSILCDVQEECDLLTYFLADLPPEKLSSALCPFHQLSLE